MNCYEAQMLYRFFLGNRSYELNLLVSPVLTFAARSRHATHIVSNDPYIPGILLVRCKLHSNRFLLRNKRIFSTINTIVICLYLSLTVIFLSYLQKQILHINVYPGWPPRLEQSAPYCKKKKIISKLRFPGNILLISVHRRRNAKLQEPEKYLQEFFYSVIR